MVTATEPSNAWIKRFEGTSILSNELSISFMASRNLFTWNGDGSCSMSNQISLYPFKASFALVKVSKPDAKLIQLKLTWTSVEKFENEIRIRRAWTKENYVVYFEFHCQICEFLAHSKEFLITFLKSKSAHLSFIALIYIICKVFAWETTDWLLIPLALVSNKPVHFLSRLWPHHIKTGDGDVVLPPVLDSRRPANVSRMPRGQMAPDFG